MQPDEAHECRCRCCRGECHRQCEGGANLSPTTSDGEELLSSVETIAPNCRRRFGGELSRCQHCTAKMCHKISRPEESACERCLSRDLRTSRLVSVRANKPLATASKTLLAIIVVNSILSQLSRQRLDLPSNDSPAALVSRGLASRFFVQAQEGTATDYCVEDYDCKDGERFCHENKCMCPRDRPIEDKERAACLSLALIGENCFTDNQCLSDAKCIDGICACSPEYISLYNPSTKVHYCHPKRRLNEDCNHDQQCPENAFCSTKKHGCLCQNGYGAAILRNNGVETVECLPKACKSSYDCESDFHVCDENKCKCLATHFDPHTALCYKFGSTGGQPDGDAQIEESSVNGNKTSSGDNDNGGIKSILKDLTMNGDRLWLVIVLLVLLTIILLALMTCLVRKYCLGYCWTVHKKEYEPNNRNPAKDVRQFDKNSINNKSFRRKKGELEDDDEDEDDIDNTAADRSNLVTTSAVSNTANSRQIAKGASPFKSNGSAGDNHYVKVDMYSTQDSDQHYPSTTEHHYQPFHQVLNRPLASSTSTPV